MMAFFIVIDLLCFSKTHSFLAFFFFSPFFFESLIADACVCLLFICFYNSLLSEESLPYCHPFFFCTDVVGEKTIQIESRYFFWS